MYGVFSVINLPISYHIPYRILIDTLPNLTESCYYLNQFLTELTEILPISYQKTMRNDTCIICKTTFTPRAGKLYCSPACKQKGYSDRVNGLIGNPEAVGENEARKKVFEFNFTEYEEYLKCYPKARGTFPFYCLLRKNVKGTPDIHQIRKYIESIEDWWWDDICNDPNSVAAKKMKEFEELYLGGNGLSVSFD
jgi:hypothetical protein